MFSITQTALPEDALLKTYRGGSRPGAWGIYGDCFSAIVDRSVTLDDFVFAFYTSTVFRMERFILRVAVGAPSSDADARAVANGSASRFAAWYVGERTPSQLLMCDRFEKTRSWFRTEPIDNGRTLLRFGTAVAAERNGTTRRMGRSFRLLLGFHVLYSQILLSAAKAKLRRA